MRMAYPAPVFLGRAAVRVCTRGGALRGCGEGPLPARTHVPVLEWKLSMLAVGMRRSVPGLWRILPGGAHLRTPRRGGRPTLRLCDAGPLLRRARLWGRPRLPERPGLYDGEPRPVSYT